jgi:redox-sensitive bicupin YhaK (pirin superfamily)
MKTQGGLAAAGVTGRARPLRPYSSIVKSPDRRSFCRGSLLAGATMAAPGLARLALAKTPPVARTSDRRVEQLMTGMATTDGAGVHLTRIIGQPALRHLDPFILLDRLHSDDPSAYLAGFPDHPHRGFETVTVMLAGRMRHRDSRGNAGLITGGGAQWMTAGRGIVHSEMPEQERGLMSGFQLWINLPAREKLCPQAYQDLAPARIAQQISRSGSRLHVIAGNVHGLRGPVRPRPTEPLLLTAILEDDHPLQLDVPVDHTAFVYVSRGSVTVGDRRAEASEIPAQTVALLSPGRRLRLRATNQSSELLIAAARPLREPIVQRGPFVMNTEEEIQKALDDYRAGTLDL